MSETRYLAEWVAAEGFDPETGDRDIDRDEYHVCPFFAYEDADAYARQQAEAGPAPDWWCVRYQELIGVFPDCAWETKAQWIEGIETPI